MTSACHIEEDLDPMDDDEKTRTVPIEELVEVLVIDVKPLRKLKIGPKLDRVLRENMVNFLKNFDVFAWTHDEMEEIDPKVMIHRLNVDPKFLPKRQKC